MGQRSEETLKEIRKVHEHTRRCSASSVLRNENHSGILPPPPVTGTIKRQTLANASEDREELLELSPKLLKRQNDGVTWKGSLEVFSKVKCGPTMGASLSPPRYLSEK